MQRDGSWAERLSKDGYADKGPSHSCIAADSLHSLCVYRLHVNAVSMNLFTHTYKCGNIKTCQKVWMVHQLSLISSLQYILSNKVAKSSKLVRQMRSRSILQLTLQTWDALCPKFSYCFCLLGLQNMLFEVAFYCALQKKITAIYHQYLRFSNSCCALTGEMVQCSSHLSQDENIM